MVWRHDAWCDAHVVVQCTVLAQHAEICCATWCCNIIHAGCAAFTNLAAERHAQKITSLQHRFPPNMTNITNHNEKHFWNDWFHVTICGELQWQCCWGPMPCNRQNALIPCNLTEKHMGTCCMEKRHLHNPTYCMFEQFIKFLHCVLMWTYETWWNLNDAGVFAGNRLLATIMETAWHL